MTVIVAALLLGVGGCYDVRETDGKTTIHYAQWVSGVAAGVSLVVVAGLAFSFSRGAAHPVRAWGLTAAIAAAAVVAVPSVYVDAVTITPTGINHSTGFWFAKSDRGFDYADVREVSIVERERTTRRGRRWRKQVDRHWVVHFRNGTVNEISPGDLWDDNQHRIIDKLEGYGVQFTGRPRPLIHRAAPAISIPKPAKKVADKKVTGQLPATTPVAAKPTTKPVAKKPATRPVAPKRPQGTVDRPRPVAAQ